MNKKNISLIVALAENNAIGKDNKLLCHLSSDLKRFKKITSGHTVIMGRNTWLSLPVRPLPGRTNIVLSDNKDDKFNGCIIVESVNEAINKCPADDECFVIGGASVYRQFLPFANKLYITKIHKKFDADAFLNDINFNQWKLISSENNLEENNILFSYEIYQK